MKASNTTHNTTNNNNTHPNRESWLQAAIGELRPDFEKLGSPLPDKIRTAIAFTSTGKRGQMQGECWHPESSDDQHHEIFIRADLSDPVDVLGVLTHELIHTVLPPEAKHGKPLLSFLESGYFPRRCFRLCKQDFQRLIMLG